jgi:hypothetical protein
MKRRPTKVLISMAETVITFLKADSRIMGLLKYVETGRRCHLTKILHYVDLNKECLCRLSVFSFKADCERN